MEPQSPKPEIDWALVAPALAEKPASPEESALAVTNRVLSIAWAAVVIVALIIIAAVLA
jgi:hypothetical protein